MPRLPRKPRALRGHGPQVQHFLASYILLLQRLETGPPGYIHPAPLNATHGDPPRASVIQYRDSLRDHVGPAGSVLYISQLHPRHRHATVLETAATDHCLAAHRSQPTPNYLFLGCSTFSSATLWILLRFFLITVWNSFGHRRSRHRPRPTFERHHDPAAQPASTKYWNRSYDQSWTLVPRPTHAGAPPLLPTWGNGSEADKRRNVFPYHHQTTLDTYHRPISSYL